MQAWQTSRESDASLEKTNTPGRAGGTRRGEQPSRAGTAPAASCTPCCIILPIAQAALGTEKALGRQAGKLIYNRWAHPHVRCPEQIITEAAARGLAAPVRAPCSAPVARGSPLGELGPPAKPSPMSATVLSGGRERSCSPLGFGVRNGSLRCTPLLTSCSRSSALPAVLRSKASACGTAREGDPWDPATHQARAYPQCCGTPPLLPCPPPGRGTSPSLRGR